MRTRLPSLQNRRNVFKSFGDKAILRGASFKIRRGEAVGIIGASGTGKSTTLRIAAGLLAPDSGEVLILGRPRSGLLSDSAEDEHLRVGMVFQNAALFDSLTVGENVGFLLYEHSVGSTVPGSACMYMMHVMHMGVLKLSSLQLELLLIDSNISCRT